MITNIFEFSDKEASDIMTHRSNIVGIDGNMTLKDCVDFMLNEGINSRYPVYIENIDHIIGIIHLKDACKFAQKANSVYFPCMESMVIVSPWRVTRVKSGKGWFVRKA